MTHIEVAKNMRIKLTAVAPVSAQFLGRTGTVVTVLPNAVMLDIEGHGAALVHRAWGTKRNPGDLAFDVL